jgi:type IV secretion system protein VirB10
VWLLGGGALLVGLAVFAALGAQRGSAAERKALPGLNTPNAVIAAPALPPELAQLETDAAGAAAPPPPFVITTTPPMPIVTAVAFGQPAAVDDSALRERRRAPALIVDLAGGQTSAANAGGVIDVGTPAQAGGAPRASADADTRNGNEQFAARASAAETERAVATVLRNKSAIVAQGALILGVLETALNSDLPGYARAVVSRDVRSFDGSRVLIPRGSRLIGEYSSGVSLGQSRLFVIWTRLITPEGVSIQIGSPGADALGRGGLEGDVNRHFFQRFGGALLMSVVNAAGSAIANGPNMQVVIGSAQSAAGSGIAPTDIAPTISVPQGTPIRVFVARDLDFTPTLAQSTQN